MKILLDTNFILTCVKESIDFDSLANEIFDSPIEWMVPQDVFGELIKIMNESGSNSKENHGASTAMEILAVLNPTIIDLEGNNPNIDIKIAEYIRGKDIILATLDKGLKGRVNNKILTIRGKKSLEIV